MRVKIPSVVTRQFGRQVLQVQKFSPQIMFVTGVVGVVASTVLACRATLKVDSVLAEAEERRGQMDEALENEALEVYTEEVHKRDLVLLKVHTARDLTKLYAPAIMIGVASIGLLTGSHVVLNRRNAGLTAAYAAVDKAFQEYRARVRQELGDERDRSFRHGFEEVSETIEGKNGPKVNTVKRVAPGEPSMYARFFDQLCAPWSPQPEYNLIFLKAQQAYANDMLRSQGHLFLNDVYKSLGIPVSKEGQVVGWVLGKGDDYVDFGIFDDTKNPNVRDFVNGREGSILLDFNVAGLIYNDI